MTYITCKSCWDKTGLMNVIIEKYIRKREKYQAAKTKKLKNRYDKVSVQVSIQDLWIDFCISYIDQGV